MDVDAATQTMIDNVPAKTGRSLEEWFAVLRDFGDDVEIAPKKTSVSLRRSKQFALVEAPSSKRVQLGGEPR